MAGRKQLVMGGLAALAALGLAAQLIRPDRTNPPEDPAATFAAKLNVPPAVADLMFTACGDCHSHRTVWPWYTQITPINWWIADHVHEGRHELNLSDWRFGDEKTRDKLQAIGEEVSEGEMPPLYYAPMHPASRLTDDQAKSITDWAKAELDRRGGPLPESDDGG